MHNAVQTAVVTSYKPLSPFYNCLVWILLGSYTEQYFSYMPLFPFGAYKPLLKFTDGVHVFIK